MENCVFCKIIAGELPGSIIYEDQDLVAFLDIQPINPGHILVLPKEHIQYIDDLSDDLLQRLFIITRNLSRALRNSGINCQGLNLLVADGQAAMQDIPHFHIHIIPRFSGDGFDFQFSPTYVELPTRDELEKNAYHIRQAVQADPAWETD